MPTPADTITATVQALTGQYAPSVLAGHVLRGLQDVGHLRSIPREAHQIVKDAFCSYRDTGGTRIDEMAVHIAAALRDAGIVS